MNYAFVSEIVSLLNLVSCVVSFCDLADVRTQLTFEIFVALSTTVLVLKGDKSFRFMMLMDWLTAFFLAAQLFTESNIEYVHFNKLRAAAPPPPPPRSIAQ